MCIYWSINTSKWTCLHQFNSCSVQYVHLFRHKQDRICTANNERDTGSDKQIQANLLKDSLEWPTCFKPTIKRIRTDPFSGCDGPKCHYLLPIIIFSWVRRLHQSIKQQSDEEFQSSKSEKHVRAQTVWGHNNASNKTIAKNTLFAQISLILTQMSKPWFHLRGFIELSCESYSLIYSTAYFPFSMESWREKCITLCLHWYLCF